MSDGPASTLEVRFLDDEPNGLADLVGRLIEANLGRTPELRRLLHPAVVQLIASDAGTTATVRLMPARVEVSNGSANPRADLRVAASANDLLELAGVPLRLGLPDVLDARGRAVLRKLLGGDVRVSGMLRHPVRLSRFNRLLSAVS